MKEMFKPFGGIAFDFGKPSRAQKRGRPSAMEDASDGYGGKRPSQELVGTVADLGMGRTVTEDGRLVVVLRLEGFDDPDIMDASAETQRYGQFYSWLRRTALPVFYARRVAITGESLCQPLRAAEARQEDERVLTLMHDWIAHIENEVRFVTYCYAVVGLQMPTEVAVDPTDYVESLEELVARQTSDLGRMAVRVTRIMGDDLVELAGDALCALDANAPWLSTGLEGRLR